MDPTVIVKGDYAALRDCPGEHYVAAYAAQHRWPLVGFTDNDPTAGTFRELMWEVIPDLTFHYVQNDVTEDCVVFVLGPDAETVRRTTDTVRKDLRSLARAELTAAAHEDDPVERGRHIMRTSFAAPGRVRQRVLRCRAARHVGPR